MRESEIERKHRAKAMKAGWFVEKVEKTARNGFPDRFYAIGDRWHRCKYCGRGRVVLIEFKAPGERVRRGSQQELRIQQLTAAGVEVYVCNSIDKADQILRIGAYEPDRSDDHGDC